MGGYKEIAGLLGITPFLLFPFIGVDLPTWFALWAVAGAVWLIGHLSNKD